MTTALKQVPVSTPADARKNLVEQAAAEISVMVDLLRREAVQPDHEEQFDTVLALGLQRIETLSETILAALED